MEVYPQPATYNNGKTAENLEKCLVNYGFVRIFASEIVEMSYEQDYDERFGTSWM